MSKCARAAVVSNLQEQKLSNQQGLLFIANPDAAVLGVTKGRPLDREARNLCPMRGLSPHHHHVAAEATLPRRLPVNQVIYLVGLIVVIMFILSFLGLR